MAQEVQSKKGGPYSKNDQQRRQTEVYRLHFDHGYSALKIAEMMKINRNTINSDIKQLYEKMSKEFSEFDAGALIIKQLNRLESQRARLFENLEGQIEMHNKLVIEKLILDIDQKIIGFSSKMISNNDSCKVENKEISNEKIMDMTRYIIKNVGSNASKIEKDEILFRIIKKEKCNVSEANQIYSEMLELGLELCTTDHGFHKNLLQFAILRGFMSINDKDEVFRVVNEESKLRVIEAEKEMEFEEKYGPKDNWSDEIWDEFDKAVENATD